MPVRQLFRCSLREHPQPRSQIFSARLGFRSVAEKIGQENLTSLCAILLGAFFNESIINFINNLMIWTKKQ